MRTKDEQFARPLKSFLTYVQKASGPEVVVFGDEYGGPDGEHFRIGVVDGGARVNAQLFLLLPSWNLLVVVSLVALLALLLGLTAKQRAEPKK